MIKRERERVRWENKLNLRLSVNVREKEWGKKTCECNKYIKRKKKKGESEYGGKRQRESLYCLFFRSSKLIKMF